MNIYLNDLISIDTFIELSIILSFVKYSTSDNIKMKETKNNEIIYSLSPLYTSNKVEYQDNTKKYFNTNHLRKKLFIYNNIKSIFNAC